MLKVKLLGQFDVHLDDKLVEIRSRPSQSLLAYLLLNEGRAVRREKAAGLHWPESSEENARSNLRHALWRLRKAIGGDYLTTDDMTIAFNVDADYWLDTAILEQKAAASDLLQAVAVYQGELLPGFYADWILPQREHLRAVFERKMQLLLEQLTGERRWPETIEWSERWISRAQIPEHAYRTLMIAHCELGDMSAVTAVYQRCLVAFAQELGIKPSAQTQELYQRLAQGKKPILAPLSAGTKTAEAPAPGSPPFKGLQFFDQMDVDLFFGRERLTTRLVARLRQSPQDFLAVVGASGIGKSSIVRAGLIPAFFREVPPAAGTTPPVHLLTPTAHPLEALSLALMGAGAPVTAVSAFMDNLANDPRSLRLHMRQTATFPSLLVIDQFEELFTLCADEVERRAFVDNLITAVSDQSPVLLILALRSDFYAHCGQYPLLRTALETNQVYIGPMNAAEMRRAVTEPARQGGWEFESGLVDLLLQEVGDEPGALPLLSHALLETWLRRRGRSMTLSGYAESGGVRGAIAQTADRALAGFTREQRAIARTVFLRLTELGEGAQDTRRRVKLAELTAGCGEDTAISSVLQSLTNARLITTTAGTVEVAHEILIRQWPVLRTWLDENRTSLKLHRHLTASALAWEKMGRDPGELYRGARLAGVAEWAEDHDRQMNALEREFLTTAQESARQREAKRQIQRRREQKAAQKLASTERQWAKEHDQSQRRLHWLTAGLALFLVVALGSALLALRQTRTAQEQTRQATARELAAAAISNLPVDPERSLLLALQAAEETRAGDGTVLPEAEDALHQAVLALRVQYTVPGTGGVAFSPDGTRIATTDLDGATKIRDATDGQELLTLSGHSDEIIDLTFSPDGTRLVTTSLDGTAKVWDAQNGAQLLTLSGHEAGLISPSISPDGGLIATTSYDGTARLWDAETSQELFILPHGTVTSGPDFSPDGTMLAVSAPFSMTVRIWDTATGGEIMALPGHLDGVNEVAFNPEGTLLAAAGSDGTAVIWDVARGEKLLTFYGHKGFVFATDFSPDGTRIATGSADGTAKIWDAATGRELLTLAGHAGSVSNVAFSPDGNRLITGSADGTARVWDISPAGSREWLTLTGHSLMSFGVAFNPDSTHLVSSSWDGTAKIWDVATGALLHTLAGHSDRLGFVAYSPDGARLATASYDGSVKLWDEVLGAELITLSGHDGVVFGVAFSPDGQRLATASEDKTVKVWDVTSGELLLTLNDPSGARFWRAVFSPDGEMLATASGNGTAVIWNAQSGAIVRTFSGHEDEVVSVTFSPDGKRLATTSFDALAKIWDVATGAELLTLSGHTGGVWDVAFTPDGARLVTAGFDGVVKFWDATSGETTLSLTSDNGSADLAMSPDGRYLATTNPDGTVKIYLLSITDLIALARERLIRGWTLDECQKYLHREECPAPG